MKTTKNALNLSIAKHPIQFARQKIAQIAN